MSDMVVTSSKQEAAFSSKLKETGDRVVAEVLNETTKAGWRKGDAFLSQFSIEDIIGSLSSIPSAKTRLLAELTGTHPKIAAKKSNASALEDLQLALDEGATTPEEFLGLFDADEWVRFLGARRLWLFLVGDKFWKSESQKSTGIARLASMIRIGIRQKVLSPRDITKTLSLEAMTSELGAAELRRVLEEALSAGQKGVPFTDLQLFDLVPLEQLLHPVSMQKVWKEIVAARVGIPLKLMEVSRNGRTAPPPAVAENVTPRAEVPALVVKNALTSSAKNSAKNEAPLAYIEPTPPSVAPASASQSRKPAKPSSQLPSAPPANTSGSKSPRAVAPKSSALNSSHPNGTASRPPTESISDVEMELTPAYQAAMGPPPTPAASQEPEGQSCAERLADLGRLPNNHSLFPPAVLLSIEAMYTDLRQTTDAQEQLTVIQEAFPNEMWRARAMLGLLELLNPTLLVTSPSVTDESADSLSIRLLTEERQRSRGVSSAQVESVPQRSVPPPPRSMPVPSSPAAQNAAATLRGAPSLIPDYNLSVTQTQGTPVLSPPLSTRPSSRPAPPPLRNSMVQRSVPPPLPARNKVAST